MDNSNLQITIPISEYMELVKAKVGIDMIGQSLGKYGPNDTVAIAVCKQFGYEYKPEDDVDA